MKTLIFLALTFLSALANARPLKVCVSVDDTAPYSTPTISLFCLDDDSNSFQFIDRLQWAAEKKKYQPFNGTTDKQSAQELIDSLTHIAKLSNLTVYWDSALTSEENLCVSETMTFNSERPTSNSFDCVKNTLEDVTGQRVSHSVDFVPQGGKKTTIERFLKSQERNQPAVNSVTFKINFLN